MCARQTCLFGDDRGWRGQRAFRETPDPARRVPRYAAAAWSVAGMAWVYRFSVVDIWL